MSKRDELLAWLDGEGVEYVLRLHEAVFTMEDIKRTGIDDGFQSAKNLFLRDHKGKRHFLVTVAGDKPVDLKALGEKLGTRLSFASAERLAKYLNLKQGEVSPLGLFYDTAHEVEMFFDEALTGDTLIGAHPGDNEATVVLRGHDLVALIKGLGNKTNTISI